MSIRAIMFDNDGTVVDTHDVILLSMKHTMQTVLGQSFSDERLLAQVGIPLDEQMMTFAQGDAELCDELLRVYRTHNHAHHDSMVRLFDGVAEGLAQLHAAGIKLGVVTAKRHALAQHGLEILDVWRYFDFLIGADDCARAKPNPDPILQGARLMGVAPQDCIYVGDSPYDMQASNAAHSITVAALWGMFPQDVLRAENPDYCARTFSEFVDLSLELIGKNNRPAF